VSVTRVVSVSLSRKTRSRSRVPERWCSRVCGLLTGFRVCSRVLVLTDLWPPNLIVGFDERSGID
jgi:hypothetical protein